MQVVCDIFISKLEPKIKKYKAITILNNNIASKNLKKYKNCLIMITLFDTIFKGSHMLDTSRSCYLCINYTVFNV